MSFYTPTERFFHSPRSCAGCRRFSLRRGPKAKRDSGVYVCNGQLWRVVGDPDKHLLHREGDAVCFEEEIWEQAKALGVTMLVVYVGDEVWLADADTFERHKVTVPWFSQVGLPRKYWQRRPRSAPALQMGLWPEKAAA